MKLCFAPTYIIDKLEKLGFDNVEINVVHDIKNSLLSTKTPYIKYFWVDDKENFDPEMYYPANIPIFVEYHDYEKKEKKSIFRKRFRNNGVTAL